MRSADLIVVLALALQATNAHAEGLDPARGTVFADPTALLQQCSRRTPAPIEGTWQPTEAQIRSLEAKLEPYLGVRLSLNDWGKMKPYKVEEYYRQYGGLIVGGRQIIYINGFHQSVREHKPKDRQDLWRTLPAAICDGGELAFGVEYDVATQTFSNFYFSGHI